MLKATISIITLALAVTVTAVNGFPQGGPNFACRSLTPGHANATQVDTPPYGISLTRDLLEPGGTTSVILESLDDFPFLGFICAVSDVYNNTVGKFSFSPTSAFSSGQTIQLLTCARSEPATGVTHVSRSDKYRVDFDWTAPPDANVGQHFKLRCSFVQTFYRCWTNIQIDISVGGHQQSTTKSTLGTEVNGIRSGNIITNNSATGESISSINGFRPFSVTSVAPRLLDDRNMTVFSTPRIRELNNFNFTHEPFFNNQNTKNINVINKTSPESDISVSLGPTTIEPIISSTVSLLQRLEPKTNDGIGSSNSNITPDSISTERRVINTSTVRNISNANFQTDSRFTNQNITSNSNTRRGSRRNTTRHRGEIDTNQRPNVGNPSIELTMLSEDDLSRDNSSWSNNITSTTRPVRFDTTTRGSNVVPNFIIQNPNAFFLRSWNIRNSLSAGRNNK